MFNSFFKIIICVLVSSEAFATQEAIDIPFESTKWISLSYNKIPANKVKFEDLVLKVKVSKSAGPIVFKLPEVKNISGFKIKGKLVGVKKIESTTFDEDSILRVGMVASGKKTLSGIKKMFAADWVKKLFALAPPDSGLDKIYFYNVTNRASLMGEAREHPKSDLIFETISKLVEGAGSFEMDVDFKKTIPVAAVWLSIDGDDSASEFEVEISSLKFNFAE